MLYGKRIGKRTARRYNKYASITKPITNKGYASVVVGCAVLHPDTAYHSFDMIELMVAQSQDWLLIKNNYSEFKMVKVVVDFSPFLQAPISTTDSANGWACIRDGYYVIPIGTLTSNEVAKFQNVVPFNNCKSYTLSRRVSSGGWFHGNETSSATSQMPKLFYYLALTSGATTNHSKGSMRVRYYMLARGSQIEQ